MQPTGRSVDNATGRILTLASPSAGDLVEPLGLSSGRRLSRDARDEGSTVLSYRYVIGRLRRFRLLKLSWLSARLESACDFLAILKLFTELFPAEYHWLVERRGQTLSPDSAYEMFLTLVERHLFPVDTWADWPYGEGDYCHIPLITFGWSLDDLSEELHLLYVPLACCLWPEWADEQWVRLERYGIDAGDLPVRVGDGCVNARDIHVPQTISRLEQMALPPPLSGLADAIRSMTGYFDELRGGNVFLSVPHLYLYESFHGGVPTWGKEAVEWLAEEWARAKPVLESAWALVDACEQYPDKPRFLRLIIQLVLGDEPDTELLAQFQRAAAAGAEERAFSHQQALVWEENSIW